MHTNGQLQTKKQILLKLCMVHHLSLLKVQNIPITSTPWTIQSQPCQCLVAYSPLLELNKNPQTRVPLFSDDTRRNWITIKSPSLQTILISPTNPSKNSTACNVNEFPTTKSLERHEFTTKEAATLCAMFKYHNIKVKRIHQPHVHAQLT